MNKQLANINHNFIRYANCWEDADVLLKGLAIETGDRVLSIGSAGDNSFSLLLHAPELVVAVDINPIQLQLIQLKKAAMQALDHSAFLQFLGFRDCTDRLDLFQKVKNHLSPTEYTFWKSHPTKIEQGIIYTGKLELYFQTFQNRFLPFIHSPKRIKDLFIQKEEQEQEQFFQRQWNNWRWRSLFKIFFSKFLMGKLGRDPEFLKEVKVPVSSFILEQARKHLSHINCQDNYFLQFILKGQFETQLPHYARKENFKKIKSRLNRLVIFNGLAEDSFKAFSGFNKFNLSNIFEYMNPSLFHAVSKNLIDHGEVGARYAYWNLMVPRKMAELHPKLITDKAAENLLNPQDKGFFYSSFNLNQKR